MPLFICQQNPWKNGEKNITIIDLCATTHIKIIDLCTTVPIKLID